MRRNYYSSCTSAPKQVHIGAFTSASMFNSGAEIFPDYVPPLS
jgi:hypothetical protein